MWRSLFFPVQSTSPPRQRWITAVVLGWHVQQLFCSTDKSHWRICATTYSYFYSCQKCTWYQHTWQWLVWLAMLWSTMYEFWLFHVT